MKKGVRLTLMFCLIFIVLALFGLVVYFNEPSLTGKAVLSQYRGSNFSAPFDFFAEGTPQIFNIVPDVFSLSSGAGHQHISTHYHQQAHSKNNLTNYKFHNPKYVLS